MVSCTTVGTLEQRNTQVSGWGFAVKVPFLCCSAKMEAAGIEPASESLQLQPLHMLFRGRDSTPPTSPVGQEGCLPGLSFARSSSKRGRMKAIPHRDALHHHRGRVMGGRWPGC